VGAVFNRDFSAWVAVKNRSHGCFMANQIIEHRAFVRALISEEAVMEFDEKSAAASQIRALLNWIKRLK